jgi:uncharacterized protein (TIGR03437 family)
VKILLYVCALTTAFAAISTAQPKIGGLLNNYSYIRPGLPNYGIAQGSIFDIFGTNLSTSDLPLQNVPLQTTLAAVTVNITVNNTTVHPPLYFVKPTQIAAILPSATPVGTGQITVTVNGTTSAPADIKVVQSAFGLLTLNGAGNGPAAAFNAQYQFLGFTNAANPGETILLWGSGVGPASGDETVLQTQTDLTNIPMAIEIGGASATVQYRGRSIYPGLDQINVVVPAGVQGCNVSVVVRTGNIVSNFATIPVAASGRTCSDQTTGLTASQLDALNGKSAYRIGAVSLGKSTTTTQPTTVGPITIPGSTTVADGASAAFYQYTPAEFSTTAFGQSASIGSCVVYTFAGSAGYKNPGQPTYLNAGAAVNVTGPNGKIVMPYQNGFYSPTAATSFIPAAGGAFTFDNGGGGPDVGAFSVNLNLASPLVWSNMSSITTVDRSQGVTVTWTGGAPNSYVQIAGTSIAINGSDTANSVGSAFVCTAPVSAGRFAVPSAVLLSVPETSKIDLGGGNFFTAGSSLSVSNYTNAVSFTANGLDLGLASAYVTNVSVVTFQ